MNPNTRPEKARAGSFAPAIQDGSERAQYENDHRPKNMIVVLSQPRCGSTLLMRLMNIACMTHVVGDHDAEFYESLVRVYRSFDTGFPTYKSIIDCEKEGVFCDTYRGMDKAADRRLVTYQIKGILTRTSGSCFVKTGIVGFGNDITEEFVSMLRDMEEDGGVNPIKIAFLTRNHDDIIKSFQTREGPGQKAAIENPNGLRDMLEYQLAQFKSCYELGDIFIKYEDLVANPKDVLLKLRPRHYPNDDLIQKIMSNKIR